MEHRQPERSAQDFYQKSFDTHFTKSLLSLLCQYFKVFFHLKEVFKCDF